MPCTRIDEHEWERANRLARELNEVTDLLCQTLTKWQELRPSDVALQLPPPVEVWWNKHKAADAKRREAEAARARKRSDRAKRIQELEAELADLRAQGEG